MATEFNSFDDFMNERSASRGSFLGNWKKDQYFRNWLHTARMPIVQWQHNFPQLVQYQDKNTQEQVACFFGKGLNCAEEQEIVEKQYFREEGVREEEPTNKCALCRLTYAFELLVAEGKVSWTLPVFRFPNDKPPPGAKMDRELIIHAGGLFNAFGGDKHTAEQKKQMADARISPKYAFRENAMAKKMYIFCVVDDGHPERGVQVAVQTGALGDAVKKVMSDRRRSKGVEGGSYVKHPYCIEWEYNEKEPNIGKKYAARVIEMVEMTPQIEKLIRGPKPSVNKATEPYNPDTLRAQLERYCICDRNLIPWDWIFKVEAPTVQPDEEFPPQEAEEPAQVAGEPQERCPVCGKTECAHVACDTCSQVILETDAKCAHCGHVYVQQPAQPPLPPPAAQMRKRSDKRDGLPF